MQSQEGKQPTIVLNARGVGPLYPQYKCSLYSVGGVEVE